MSVVLFQGHHQRLGEYGLFLTDGTRWTEFKLGEHGLPCGLIQPYMAADSQARLWFAMVLPSYDSVLCCFDGETTRVYDSISNRLPFSVAWVIDLYVDKTDRVWVSALGSGVYTLSGEQWTDLADEKEEEFSDQAIVTNVGEDRKGSLWLACTDMKETHFLSKHSGDWKFVCSCPVRFRGDALDLAAAYQRRFAIDKNGQIWFGGPDISLMMWNGKRWQQLSKRDSPLFPRGISGLLIDEFDNVWVGTGSGFAVFDGLRWAIWGAIHPNSDCTPIPSQGPWSEILDPEPEYVIISGMAVMDGRGRKWLESPQGIVMFSPTQNHAPTSL
jgi:ligand-binding sensor domain-containing protein